MGRPSCRQVDPTQRPPGFPKGVARRQNDDQAVVPLQVPCGLHEETLSKIKQSEWKGVPWKDVPTVSFDVECSVTVPQRVFAGKVLLLVEFPGRTFCPSRCAAWVDGQSVRLEERASTEHIGYYNWTGLLRPFESEWCWYLCDVSRGSHRVKFHGAAGNAKACLGLWAWAERDLTDSLRPSPLQCAEPAMPQYRDRIERQGICLLAPGSP